jgi:hypothetical protein
MLTIAAVLSASACNGSTNAVVFGPFGSPSNESTAVASDSMPLASPLPDPPYGSAYGMGGTFEPPTISGF